MKIISTANLIAICPTCQNKKETYPGFRYGEVNVAPIPQQVADLRKGIQREYRAARCYCEVCDSIWDVVLINKEIPQA